MTTNIRSIQLVVPSKRCINNCKFCIAKLTGNRVREYQSRKVFEAIIEAREHSDTITLTGNTDPMQNMKIVKYYLEEIRVMEEHECIEPFREIGIQVSGVLITNEKIQLLSSLGINRLNISVASWHPERDMMLKGVAPNLVFDWRDVVQWATNAKMRVRFVGILSDDWDEFQEFTDILHMHRTLQERGIDQVTFKVMQGGLGKTFIDKWIREHRMKHLDYFMHTLRKVYQEDIGGIVVNYKFDMDCQAPGHSIIIREDGECFTSWEEAYG